ncbi:MAG: tetraacyldisaccharide 4'-kinase [Nitrospinota bacterium]
MKQSKLEKIITNSEKAGYLFLFLFPLQIVYRIVIYLRNLLYDKSIFKQQSVKPFIISVGSIAFGGSGKTPITAYIARILIRSNYKVAILARGYKTKIRKPLIVSDYSSILLSPPDAPDEPFLLAKNLNVPVVCTPKRIIGAKLIERKFQSECIILDDGFQHRSIHRDLNILTIDINDIFNSNLLPLGPLREPVANLKRADIIILFINGDYKREQLDLDQIRNYINKLNKSCELFFATGEIEAFINFKTNEQVDIKGATFLFSAIAKPDRFLHANKVSNLTIKGYKNFRDHHLYSEDDLKMIVKLADKLGALNILTTEKDIVKLINHQKIFENSNLLFTKYEAKIIDDSEKFEALLNSKFSLKKV